MRALSNLCPPQTNSGSISALYFSETDDDTLEILEAKTCCSKFDLLPRQDVAHRCTDFFRVIANPAEVQLHVWRARVVSFLVSNVSMTMSQETNITRALLLQSVRAREKNNPISFYLLSHV